MAARGDWDTAPGRPRRPTPVAANNWRPTPVSTSGYRDRSAQDWAEAPAATSYFRSGVGRTPESWAGWRDTFASNGLVGGYGDYFLRNGGNMGALLGQPQQGGGGGGGGGGRRGGGGGGGGGAVTQQMIDAMASVLGIMPQQQQWTDVKLPAFQGQNIAAFDQTPYNQLEARLAGAMAADSANINAGEKALASALTSNYQNPYANAQVIGAPQGPAPMGAALAGAAGGDTGALTGAAQGAAAGEQGSQAAFQNLLNVLSGASEQSQASRMNQAAMDANTARQNLGAQRTGLAGQIGMQRSAAQQQWAQQDADRRYQNSMMQQQMARELALSNAQGRQSTANANISTRNETLASRIQPLLELIGATQGTGLNLNSLQQLLKRFGIAA